MAYTAYRTWTTGEIVTAALMNEQVRDNGLLTAPAIMTGAGDLIYSSAANTPTRLAKDTNSTRVLTNTGTSNVPAWAQVTLTSGVTGTLPVANGGTNLTSLGSGVATFMGTPSSANLRGALTDETGTGSAVFATSPTLVTPALGTPASGVLTNATGLPTAGIVDDAVTLGKMAGITRGSIIYGNASGDPTALAKGSADEVLTSDGTDIAWAAAGGGGQMVLIGTIVATDDASLIITGLNSTYDSYLILLSDLHPATDGAQGELLCGDSSGIDSASGDYSWWYMVMTGSADAFTSGSSTSDDRMRLGGSSGNDPGEGISGAIWLNMPGDSGMFSQFVGNTNTAGSGDAVGRGSSFAGARLAVITLDRIQFNFSTGNVESGRMTILGVKHT